MGSVSRAHVLLIESDQIFEGRNHRRRDAFIPTKEQKAVMASDAAIDRVKSELNRAFEKTRADLERIEILAAGLAVFKTTIPRYEPRLQHLRFWNVKATD